MTRQVAVIGAGMAGLACARVLRHAGCYVDVFERDRILGGRMSTTRLGIVPFDHGAQYLTARSSSFKDYLSEIAGMGYASRWTPRIAGAEGSGQLYPWFVGVPGMSALVRPMAESVRVHFEHTVHTIRREDKGWYVWFEDQTAAGPFHAVAITAPAPETRLLLGPLPDLSSRLAKVRMSPCWALLVRLDKRILPEQDVYSDMSDVVRWIARNNSKPGRSGTGDQIVIHAGQAWSRETEDVEAEVVASELWNEVSNLLELPPVRPVQMSAVLWRHGLVDQSLNESFIFSTTDMVGAAGDWCLGRLAEHAFESGVGLGKAIVNAF